MTAWTAGRMVGYDLEATDKDPLTAHIVTAAIVHVTPGQRPTTIQWLIDPGCELEPEASAVNGWTRTRILDQVGGDGMALRITDGNRMRMAADGAIGEIAGHLGVAIHTETPLVIHNAAYDTTLTEVECGRYGIDPRPASDPAEIDDSTLGDLAHIAKMDPAFTLAWCAAIRAVVGRHSGVIIDSGLDDENGDRLWLCGECEYPMPCPTLRALAQPFAGGEGWQEGWAL